MTTNDPDQIRADIAATRSTLSDDVDALTDKVSPSRVADRQKEKVRSKVSSVKDKVFGAADHASSSVHDARGSVSDSAHGLADSAKGAPHLAKEKAQGNPIAAGLIAFGAGLLVSSLIPSSQKEREAVRAVKDSDAMHTVTDEVKQGAKDLGQNLKEPAMQAADQVKATATDGAAQVKDTATSGAQDVKSEAQQASSDVKDTASGS